jgi:hypothetical protein
MSTLDKEIIAAQAEALDALTAEKVFGWKNVHKPGAGD